MLKVDYLNANSAKTGPEAVLPKRLRASHSPYSCVPTEWYLFPNHSDHDHEAAEIPTDRRSWAARLIGPRIVYTLAVDPESLRTATRDSATTREVVIVTGEDGQTRFGMRDNRSGLFLPRDVDGVKRSIVGVLGDGMNVQLGIYYPDKNSLQPLDTNIVKVPQPKAEWDAWNMGVCLVRVPTYDQ
jgi:hypothetical protein